MVAVNTGAAQTLTFDLSRFAQAAGPVTRWSTMPAGSDRYTPRTDLTLSSKTVRVSFPAASVQTLQLDGVVL